MIELATGWRYSPQPITDYLIAGQIGPANLGWGYHPARWNLIWALFPIVDTWLTDNPIAPPSDQLIRAIGLVDNAPIFLGDTLVQLLVYPPSPKLVTYLTALCKSNQIVLKHDLKERLGMPEKLAKDTSNNVVSLFGSEQ